MTQGAMIPITVYVKDFNIVPANTAEENDIAFSDMRNILLNIQASQANTHFFLNFEPGRYQYNNNRWLMGFNRVDVNARGAEFQCMHTGGVGFSWAFQVPTMFRDTIYETLEQTAAPLAKFKSVAAGAMTVELENPQDAALFAVGGRVYLYGFDQQGYGYPPNARFFEVQRVAGLSGAIVTFENPLRFRYDDRWPDLPGDHGIGPGRMMSLDRENYTYPEHVAIRGATIVSGPVVPDGSVVVLGARNVLLEGFHNAIIWPNESDKFVIRDSNLLKLEMDKLVDTVIIDNCKTSDRITQGTGIRHAIIENSVIDSVGSNFIDYSGRKLTLRNNQFFSPPDHAFGWVGLSLLYPMDDVVVENNYIVNRSGAANFISVSGNQPLIVKAVGINNAIQLDALNADDQFIFRSLDYGTMLYGTGVNMSQNKNRGIVTELYRDGDFLVIEGTWKFAPSVGQIFVFSVMKNDVTHSGNTLVSPVPFTLVG